jgi:hypothetical protein
MPSRVLLAILMPMLLLVVGSRFAARGADAPATQPATTGESVLAAESPHEAVATRPTTWLTLDGGDGDVLYRGWPIRIELHTATTAPTTPTVAITIHGPADISPHPAPDAPGVWLITPENSTAMPAGKYVVSVGTALADIVLADEPPTLSPAQQEAKQIARASYALALGDLPGAIQANLGGATKPGVLTGTTIRKEIKPGPIETGSIRTYRVVMWPNYRDVECSRNPEVQRMAPRRQPRPPQRARRPTQRQSHPSPQGQRPQARDPRQPLPLPAPRDLPRARRRDEHPSARAGRNPAPR